MVSEADLVAWCSGKNPIVSVVLENANWKKQIDGARKRLSVAASSRMLEEATVIVGATRYICWCCKKNRILIKTSRGKNVLTVWFGKHVDKVIRREVLSGLLGIPRHRSRQIVGKQYLHIASKYSNPGVDS